MAKEELHSTEIVRKGVKATGPNAGSERFSVRVRRGLPDFLQSVNLKHVKLGYHYLIGHAICVLIIPALLVAFSAGMSTLSQQDVWQLWAHLRFNLVTVLACSGAIVFSATVYCMSRPRPVYLLDFACYKPRDEFKVTREMFLKHSKETGKFSESSLEFQRNILERSGLGEETYVPGAILSFPPNRSMEEARAEAEMVMFGALDELFEKTRLRPKDVGILIVNCSLFNPTPSLSAMIINQYKMRGNIISFNIGGMGCSSGIIALDLAKDLLQLHSRSYAVVMSTENITLNWYMGNKRSMLLPNCLFRMGGAAILLSNMRRDRRAKYQLTHLVRTHKGANDRSYRCVFQEEDEHQQIGLSLSPELMEIAGDALKANITTLAPLVLPLSEQLIFLATLICTKVLKIKHTKPYIPDFKLAFEHFCIHAGGRAVLDELQKNLGLTDTHMEPGRMTLHRFGNTSSSCLWYELAYLEAKGRVKKGERVWQIGFGSGFKCNSAVWKALKTSPDNTAHNPWSDCIDAYPLQVHKIKKLAS